MAFHAKPRILSGLYAVFSRKSRSWVHHTRQALWVQRASCYGDYRKVTGASGARLTDQSGGTFCQNSGHQIVKAHEKHGLTLVATRLDFICLLRHCATLSNFLYSSQQPYTPLHPSRTCHNPFSATSAPSAPFYTPVQCSPPLCIALHPSITLHCLRNLPPFSISATPGACHSGIRQREGSAAWRLEVSSDRVFRP